MRQSLSNIRIPALVLANILAFGFIVAAPADALVLRGDVDACDEGPGVGCDCLEGTPFTPPGCYQHDEPGEQNCWSQAGCDN